MNQNPSVCQNCGALLAPGSKFCEQCGAPAGQPTPQPQAAYVPPAQPPAQQPPVSSPPEQQPPTEFVTPQPVYTQPSQARRSNTCLIVGLIVLFLCVCLAGVGFIAYRTLQSQIGNIFKNISVDLMGTVVPTPTEGTISTLESVEPTPTESVSDTPQSVEPTVVQKPGAGSTSYFDDFSDTGSRWAVGSDDMAAWGYEAGEYFILIKKVQVIYWMIAPTELAATDLEFDAHPAQNYSDNEFGTYGAVCHYSDNDNFYFVEADPSSKAVYFGKYLQGELVTLSDPRWIDAKNFKPSSGDVNHIQISCTGTKISLYLNGQFETEITDDSAPSGGFVGFFAATYDGLPQGGFKVFFDNFSAWVPAE